MDSWEYYLTTLNKLYTFTMCSLLHINYGKVSQWCRRRLWRVPWTARRSSKSILKEISPGISLDGMMLKLKLQYFGHLMQSWLIGKDSDAGRDWGQEEKGMTEDEMAGWHPWLDGRESEWTPGVGDEQGGLACCNSWGRKESDTTECLSFLLQKQVWTTINLLLFYFIIQSSLNKWKMLSSFELTDESSMTFH